MFLSLKLGGRSMVASKLFKLVTSDISHYMLVILGVIFSLKKVLALVQLSWDIEFWGGLKLLAYLRDVES